MDRVARFIYGVPEVSLATEGARDRSPYVTSPLAKLPVHIHVFHSQ